MAGSARLPRVPAELARFYEQQVTWRPCGGEFSCTRVRVPLDYARPDGETIELALVRLSAGGGQRIGSLVVNPGGPGGSGIQYARQARQLFTEAVLERYDLVGLDPRGVGQSAPVECLSDAELDRYLAVDASPDSAAEEQRLVDSAGQLARGCDARSARLLPHVGTADVARDLDVVRAVLGDERLNYLGKSYGTFLGATYAELFPGRVGALVLDGALDPRISGAELAAEQAKGFDTALNAFLDDCLERPSVCPLSGPRPVALRQLQRLLQRIDARPLTSSSGRRVNESLAALGMGAALYEQKIGWPLLRLGLREAQRGRGDFLLTLADAYTDRGSDGRYESNSNEAQPAVNCLDRPEIRDLAALRAQAKRITTEAPTFGRYLGWAGLTCYHWPVPPTGGPRAIHAPGSRPILVVGTVRDPATPYRWAVGLAEQLHSGVLLTWNGDGHTAYKRGSACVDAVVDAYLLRGEVPDGGKRCD